MKQAELPAFTELLATSSFSSHYNMFKKLIINYSYTLIDYADKIFHILL